MTSFEWASTREERRRRWSVVFISGCARNLLKQVWLFLHIKLILSVDLHCCHQSSSPSLQHLVFNTQQSNYRFPIPSAKMNWFQTTVFSVPEKSCRHRRSTFYLAQWDFSRLARHSLSLGVICDQNLRCIESHWKDTAVATTWRIVQICNDNHC